MSHPLDGCWAKIERAKEQTRLLDNEFVALRNSGAYTILGENQSQRSRYAFKLLGPPVPLRFSVIAGEIVHHLRSALDHVVWALAKKNAIPDDERIQFPVCATREKFERAVRNGIIKGVSRSDRVIIDALQPYRSPDSANSIIQIVHDLDIADKHKLLVVVSHILVMGNTLTITRHDLDDPTFGIELPPITGYPWAMEDGIEVHWVPVRGPPNPTFEMQCNAVIQIALDQVGTVKREPVIPLLMHLCDGVEAAIHSFDGCF